MTSKEKIQKFIDEIKPFPLTRRTSFSINEIVDMLERAVKDLEVLELLKKSFRYNEKEDLYFMDRMFWKAGKEYGEGWEKHNEEYRKIKEWYEHDQ